MTALELLTSKLEKLNNAPHYMVCDENTAEQRHGLGLLIVKQIISAHDGTTIIEHSSYGGFSVKITVPIQDEYYSAAEPPVRSS